MLIYLAKRIAQALLIMLGVSIITYVLLYLVPADPVRQIAGRSESPRDNPACRLQEHDITGGRLNAPDDRVRTAGYERTNHGEPIEFRIELRSHECIRNITVGDIQQAVSDHPDRKWILDGSARCVADHDLISTVCRRPELNVQVVAWIDGWLRP